MARGKLFARVARIRAKLPPANPSVSHIEWKWTEASDYRNCRRLEAARQRKWHKQRKQRKESK